ncbi:hypothetical protein B0H19DRAFT_1376984 [Mycena capillaripes]|nr:hypothetical protein B0H19DRAFT_1376984 [Mycena capillaripes]
MSGSPTRTLRNPRNPGQGTAFHELVVAPTFTPDLARPYQVPGSDIVINPLAPYGRTVAGSGAVPGSTPENTVDQSTAADDGDVEKPRSLYVHVTLEWTERAARSMRSNARSKKMHESKFVSTPVDVLSSSRVAFIPIALGAHGYDDVYIAGVASGPAMRIYWAGSPGGKGEATVILYDKDWDIIVQKLADVIKSSKKLDTISVVFDLDGMDGFKQRSKRIRSPDPYESELSFGTRVPNTDNCTPAQLAHGAAMDEIKAAHSCAEHGTCFIDGNGQHLEMNRFRIGAWGHAVLAGKCRPEDPPPKDLLTAWTGGSASASGSKPRGRTGPFPAQQPASKSSESTNLLLTSMVPVMAMMAQNMASNFSAPAPVATPSAPRSPVQVSSPPPAIEDDLDVFMDAYRRAKNMPDTRIDNAKAQLRDVCYTPDILAESSVTLERLMELTGFAEGEVHGLKKFARQWTGRIEGKRARRNIPY